MGIPCWSLTWYILKPRPKGLQDDEKKLKGVTFLLS